MGFKIETIDNTTIVILRGELDRSTRGDIEIELLDLVRYGSNLVVDLSSVDYISSAGLHLLLNLYRRCEQHNMYMALTGLSEKLRNILSLTRLTPSPLPIFPTLDDGINALRSLSKPASRSRSIPDEVIQGAFENASEETDRAGQEDVNFSAFYPKEIAVENWYTLLVYTYVPSVLDKVREDAKKFEDEIGQIRESKAISTTKLKRGSEVTIIPSCEGVSFNPERITHLWLEDQHHSRFRMRAEGPLAGMAGNLQVTIYVGPLIVGTLKIGVLFNETEPSPKQEGYEEARTEMYKQEDIFISYSHRDTEIVRGCKKAYEALGHNVLIDFETLRAGQNWNAELMNMIDRSDIFQLFWSENSSKSEYCRQEWQYALNLGRGEGFIRPVFWKEPIPNPPAELSSLHFDYIPFSG